MAGAIVEDLVRHKWYANAAYLAAVYGHEAARQDEELRKLFLHILVANRFWLFLTLGKVFDRESESRFPDSLEPLIENYKETAALEMEWLLRCDDAEWHRQLATPRLPGKRFTVSEAVMQICLHSYGHRSQSAIRLRSLGGTPPATDFILWVTERPGPAWPPRDEHPA
jgi:uncharacterized damage-inducible protein DinB